jgi:hypothetical protein
MAPNPNQKLEKKKNPSKPTKELQAKKSHNFVAET